MVCSTRTFLAALIRVASLVWIGTCITIICIGMSPDYRKQFSRALVAPLENRFRRPILDDNAHAVGIIVLGHSEARLREALNLVRRYPNARVLLSGDSERTRQRVLQHGLAAWRVAVETKSKNTFENAVFARRLLQWRSGERFILVTSAQHMPRAMGCFRKAGIPVEAWPVHEPQVRSLDRLHVAAHEWGGLLWYWIEGKTDALFPRQSDTPARVFGHCRTQLGRGADGVFAACDIFKEAKLRRFRARPPAS